MLASRWGRAIRHSAQRTARVSLPEFAAGVVIDGRDRAACPVAALVGPHTISFAEGREDNPVTTATDPFQAVVAALSREWTAGHDARRSEDTRDAVTAQANDEQYEPGPPSPEHSFGYAQSAGRALLGPASASEGTWPPLEICEWPTWPPSIASFPAFRPISPETGAVPSRCPLSAPVDKIMLSNLSTSVCIGVDKLLSAPPASGSEMRGSPSGSIQNQRPDPPRSFHFLTGMPSAARRSVRHGMPAALAAASTSCEGFAPSRSKSRRNPSARSRGSSTAAPLSRSPISCRDPMPDDRGIFLARPRQGIGLHSEVRFHDAERHLIVVSWGRHPDDTGEGVKRGCTQDALSGGSGSRQLVSQRERHPRPRRWHALQA